MGDKYVVFVDQAEVAGTFGLAAAPGSFSITEEAGRAEEFALRRSLLDTIASSVVGQAAGEAGAGGVTEAMGSFALGVEDGTIDPTAEPPAREGVAILEGINALIVDEEVASLEALQQLDGVTVFENVELFLPEPVKEDEAEAEAGAAVEAASAWHLPQIGLSSGEGGGEGVLVGILDTGIDSGHPEFSGKIVHFQEFDWLGNEVPGPARDAGDHGTHVSSIVAGSSVGVAPGADLAVAAVLTKAGPRGMSGSLVQIVRGFNWLVTTPFRDDPGVDIVNASLGGLGFSPYLQPSVQSARAVGVLLVAAIGNNGRGGVGRHGSPGNYREALSVGATDNSDTVADFSDWGVAAPPPGPKYPLPELSAPGVRVYAAVPGGGYALKSGTSMATPVVTGVAARHLSAKPELKENPDALIVQLRSKLATCHPNALGNRGGAGRIEA